LFTNHFFYPEILISPLWFFFLLEGGGSHGSCFVVYVVAVVVVVDLGSNLFVISFYSDENRNGKR